MNNLITFIIYLAIFILFAEGLNRGTSKKNKLAPYIEPVSKGEDHHPGGQWKPWAFIVGGLLAFAYLYYIFLLKD